MQIQVLEAIHAELYCKYDCEIPGLSAFKEALKEGRLEASIELHTGICNAVISGENEGTWEITEEDIEI